MGRVRAFSGRRSRKGAVVCGVVLLYHNFLFGIGLFYLVASWVVVVRGVVVCSNMAVLLSLLVALCIILIEEL